MVVRWGSQQSLQCLQEDGGSWSTADPPTPSPCLPRRSPGESGGVGGNEISALEAPRLADDTAARRNKVKDKAAFLANVELDKEIEDIHRKIQGQIPKPNIGPKKVPGGGTSSPKPPSDAHVDLKPFEKPASHEDHEDQNELATGPGMVTNKLSFCSLFHGAIKHWFVRKAN